MIRITTGEQNTERLDGTGLASGVSIYRLNAGSFTATRRIGGAVQRNRAKRRLREAARLTAPGLARAGCDYVLIARSGVVSRPWPALLDDVKSALIRLAADLGAPLGETAAPPPNSGPAAADE